MSILSSGLDCRWIVAVTLLHAVVIDMHLCTAATPVASAATVAIAGDMSSEQIRETARRVMEQNDFRSVRRRVLEDIPETDYDKGFVEGTMESIGNSIQEFFEWLFTPSGGPTNAPSPQPTRSPGIATGLTFGISQIILYLAIIAVIGLIIWMIAMIAKSSDGRSRSSGRPFPDDEDGIADLSVPPGELATSTYESRALQLAADGNFRAAIRELLLGSMSWIERAGMIRFRKGLTNRDYIRAVWRQPPRRDAYSTTALEFERVYFGRRDATREMFQHCLTSFQEAFREETSTTTSEV